MYPCNLNLVPVLPEFVDGICSQFKRSNREAFRNGDGFLGTFAPSTFSERYSFEDPGTIRSTIDRIRVTTVKSLQGTTDYRADILRGKRDALFLKTKYEKSIHRTIPQCTYPTHISLAVGGMHVSCTAKKLLLRYSDRERWGKIRCVLGVAIVRQDIRP